MRQREVRLPGRGFDSGMTLAEVLVAMMVFLVAASVALILFRVLTRAYETGWNAATTQ